MVGRLVNVAANGINAAGPNVGGLALGEILGVAMPSIDFDKIMTDD